MCGYFWCLSEGVGSLGVLGNGWGFGEFQLLLIGQTKGLVIRQVRVHQGHLRHFILFICRKIIL